MNPIFGFALYLLACAGVSYYASTQGRKGWLYFLITVPLGFPLVILGNVNGTSHIGTALLAFASPAAALMFIAAGDSKEQIQAAKDEASGLKACPFCAEPIKAEAIKCKHCGSEIPHTA